MIGRIFQMNIRVFRLNIGIFQMNIRVFRLNIAIFQMIG
jgi:hypothetical protein